MSMYQSDDFFKIKQPVVDALKIQIFKTFFDQKSGLFKSLSKGEWISLEGNLYALEDDLFLNDEEKINLYKNLVQSKLWNAIPGIPTVPDYPKKQISYTTKLVGLRHYHDGFTWPWLTAFSAKIAGLMGDSTTQRFLMEKLQEWAIRDNAIHEVLNPKKDFRPVRKPFYRSESPFSWASGFVLDSLHVDAPSFPQ